MTRHTYALLAPLWVATGFVSAGCAASQLEMNYQQKIDELLPGMGAADPMARKDPQLAFEKICFAAGAPGKEAERAALCRAIMARVGPDTAKPARIWMLRKLDPMGRDEVVAGLARLMRDPDAEIRETARRALANNPSPKAAAALRAELAKADNDEWRVAMINALGWRGDTASVRAFIRFAGDRNEAVAKAAIAALGDVADDVAVAALGDMLKAGRPSVRDTVIDANLRAAEQLAVRGKQAEAAAIYERMLAASQPEPVRVAGVYGLAAARGEEALPQLVALIAGKDARMQLAAARAAQDIPGRAVTSRLAAAMNEVSPEGQALLLDVLGRRGDPEALPAVTSAVRSEDSAVRLAALGALRFIGNGSSVALLAERAAGGTPEEQTVARDALARLRGADIDGVVIDAIGSANGPVRGELVKAAAARRITAAVPLLFAAAADADESVRVAALNALGGLSTAKDLGKLVDILVKAEGEQTLKAAEDAVVGVAQKLDDREERTAQIVAAMNGARPTAQASLVRVLGRLQGRSALAAVRKASTSDDAVVKAAATEALARWGSQYCDAWLFSGPYKEEGKKCTDLFDIAFDPEKPDAKPKWKPLKQKFEKQDGLYELHKLVKEENVCGYVKTAVWSETEQKARLELGSDDGIKVWLNGEVVHQNNATRACRPAEDVVNVTLKKGWNTLMLKITQGGSDWSFCCGIKAADGAPIDGLKFEAK